MTVHSIILYNMVLLIWYYWVSPIWSDLVIRVTPGLGDVPQGRLWGIHVHVDSGPVRSCTFCSDRLTMQNPRPSMKFRHCIPLYAHV